MLLNNMSCDLLPPNNVQSYRDNIESPPTVENGNQNLVIINDIESGKMTSQDIMQKYNLTKYKYYKILNEFGIKNPCMKTGPKGPTGSDSHFKQLMSTKLNPIPSDFKQEEFCNDIKSGLKIIDIVKKYNITLFQFRELRKKYDIKK